MRDAKLIVFAREAVPGRVKTRLISDLGPDGAASLYRGMAACTLNWASRLDPGNRGIVEVSLEGDPGRAASDWPGPEIRFVSQGEGGLGERMARAFALSFEAGKKRVVLIGTDCPELSVAHVRAAWETLRRADLVLGPTQDGGYCLVGLRKDTPAIFEGIEWGAEKVLSQTLDKASALGLTVECLPPLRDVDTRDDLEVWERASRRTISAVIPTLDEERDLPRALGSLQASPGVELVVADGGSRDATLEVAGRAGARLVHSAPGRARQLNAGAGAASGDILLFLHADTSLPAGFDSLVRDSFADPAVVGGSFALSFDPCPPLLKVNEITANWRARFLHLPFGDQALFVKASIFRLLGGFREMPLLEDVDFVRRLSRAGKLAFLGRPVRTSSRRYGREIFRTTLRNKAVFLGYFLGVRPERLARLYGRRQRDG